MSVSTVETTTTTTALVAKASLGDWIAAHPQLADAVVGQLLEPGLVDLLVLDRGPEHRQRSCRIHPHPA